MPYKTILIHCNDKHRLKMILPPAVSLAEQFHAHLVGLSVVPPVVVVAHGAVGGPPIVIDAHCELYRADSVQMKTAFDSATRGQAFGAEWREEDAGALSVATIVLPYARGADLVVASQTDAKWPGDDRLDIADRLVIESGRPILIVPKTRVHERLGEKVLVGWNARREAARAVFDALPILQGAEEVKVVFVNPQSERELAKDIPSADICAALARHGVKCKATELVRSKIGVGETLLACANDYGADLLVMGCFGHSRLREFVFGGATRHVLAHMPIPVLMSH